MTSRDSRLVLVVYRMLRARRYRTVPPGAPRRGWLLLHLSPFVRKNGKVTSNLFAKFASTHLIRGVVGEMHKSI